MKKQIIIKQYIFTLVPKQTKNNTTFRVPLIFQSTTRPPAVEVAKRSGQVVVEMQAIVSEDCESCRTAGCVAIETATGTLEV